jgi:hypothetical protein
MIVGQVTVQFGLAFPDDEKLTKEVMEEVVLAMLLDKLANVNCVVEFDAVEDATRIISVNPFTPAEVTPLTLVQGPAPENN